MERDEWALSEDYRYYCRVHEDEQDNGNVSREAEPDTFEEWLADQTAEYLDAHGVVEA